MALNSASKDQNLGAGKSDGTARVASCHAVELQQAPSFVWSGKVESLDRIELLTSIASVQATDGIDSWALADTSKIVSATNHVR